MWSNERGPLNSAGVRPTQYPYKTHTHLISIMLIRLCAQESREKWEWNEESDGMFTDASKNASAT